MVLRVFAAIKKEVDIEISMYRMLCLAARYLTVWLGQLFSPLGNLKHISKTKTTPVASAFKNYSNLVIPSSSSFLPRIFLEFLYPDVDVPYSKVDTRHNSW
jgi:hypothetical protein